MNRIGISQRSQDKRVHLIDFNSRQEARFEAMKHSKYSSIVYKQHEELQRRFERQASLIEKTKKVLASDIRKIQNKRREYREKYDEVKYSLDYFRDSSSIIESQISTLRQRHANFQQSQRVIQFLDQYGSGTGVYMYGDYYPTGKITFLPDITEPVDNIFQCSNQGSSSNTSRRSRKDLYLTDGGRAKTRLSLLSHSLPPSENHSLKTGELLKLEYGRDIDQYKPLNRHTDFVHLFSIRNVTNRSVYVKQFPGKKLFR